MISSSPFLMNQLIESNSLATLPLSISPPTWISKHSLVDTQKVAIIGYSNTVLLWNSDYLTRNNLPIPHNWQDLTNAIYFHHLTMTTPTRSGTTQIMIESILQHYGWQKGWRLILNMGANLATISSRSFSVSESISRGQIGLGAVIESYAVNLNDIPFLDSSALNNVALMPLYIGIIKKQQQNELALKFIKYILSNNVQSNLIQTPFAKHSVNKALPLHQKNLFLDKDLLISREFIINRLFDLAISEQLPQLQDAWLNIITAQKKYKHSARHLKKIQQAKHQLFTLPITEQEVQEESTYYQNSQQMNPQKIGRILQWKNLLSKQIQDSNNIISQLSKKNDAHEINQK